MWRRPAINSWRDQRTIRQEIFPRNFSFAVAGPSGRPAQAEMMQQPMLNGAAPVVVFGIEVQDPALVGKIKTVCIVATIMAICNLSWGVYNLTFGLGGLAVIGCALCVPACGYFGAKNKNKELLCAF